ncbi:MAG: methyltransferase domain-containing protein [Burkholderiales bacterium]|nr:methyltransferase domain-containing protein [Burkholderiales bacterium]
MRSLLRLAALVLPLLTLAGVQAQDKPPINAGPYVPSPDSAVSAMLREAQVGPDDFLIDLGSGDGKIVRTAAKVFGARGLGVEIQEPLVALSNELAKKEGTADRVSFVRQDLFKTDLSPATVVTLYLLPHTVNLLRAKLLDELRPGARVVAHDYGLAGWLPQKVVELEDPEKVAISGVARTVIYLYVVPAKVAGTWSVSVPPTVAKGPMRLELTQQLTSIAGEALIDGKTVPLADARLVGDEISFDLPGRDAVFRGKVRGRTIEGSVESAGVRAPWRATLGR